MAQSDDPLRCICHSGAFVNGYSDRLIALIGLQDLVVVDTGDVLLISAMDKVADIKKVLEQLRITGRPDKLYPISYAYAHSLNRAGPFGFLLER